MSHEDIDLSFFVGHPALSPSEEQEQLRTSLPSDHSLQISPGEGLESPVHPGDAQWVKCASRIRDLSKSAVVCTIQDSRGGREDQESNLCNLTECESKKHIS